MTTLRSSRTAFALSSLLAAVAAQATTTGSGAALNVTAYEYYSSTKPTIDLMKKGSPWLTQCNPYEPGNCSGFADGAGNWDTLEQAKLDLDENGWPQSLPASNAKDVKYRYVTTLVVPAGAVAGKYIVRYEGEGTLTYGGSGRKLASESRTGRDVVEIPANSDNPTWISVTSTKVGNHLRNIRMFEPGGVCGSNWTEPAANASACTGKDAFLAYEDFPKSQIFHPKFLADMLGFRTVRFLDWLGPMTNPSVQWRDRTRFSYRTWAGSPTGTPYRAIFQLTRQIRANPWITLPPYMDDEYARRFGRMAAKQLAPDATLYLEYANEPWNYAFQTSHWMKEQALKLWTPTPEHDAYMLQANWYAKRSAEVCQLVKAEFGGAAGRVKCVQNAQAANSWMTDYTLQCPVAAKTLGTSCDKRFDVVAIAPYFGDYINDPSYRATISTWYREPDGGVSKMFQELTGTDDAGKTVTPPLFGKGTGAPKGALARSAGWMQESSKVATAHGLKLMAYEGGQHLVGGGDAAYGELIGKANRDPRMGKAYQRMMNDWQAAGGQTFAYYSYVGAASRYGAWGLKATQDDDKSVKWQTVLPVRDGRCWWMDCGAQP